MSKPGGKFHIDTSRSHIYHLRRVLFALNPCGLDEFKFQTNQKSFINFFNPSNPYMIGITEQGLTEGQGTYRNSSPPQIFFLL
jgi:hypothetical protein